MALLDGRTLRVLFTTVVFLGIAAIVYFGRRILLALVLAVLFAYVLEPIVRAAQRWLRGSRGAAIAVVYAVGIALLIAAVMIALPWVRSDGVHAASALPALSERIANGTIAWQVGQSRGWSDETRARIAGLLAGHRTEIATALRVATARAAALGAYAGYVVLIPIFAIFFLKDKSCVADMTMTFVSAPRRPFARRVLDDLDRMLAQYIRAQLIISALAMAAYTIVLMSTGFAYGPILGLLCGALEFIPFVGPAVSAAALIVIAIFTGYDHWLVLLLFLPAWRVVQDYVNTPYFMGEGLDLHPLVTIGGVLIGGEVFGVAGMFLSIPAIAALRIFWHHWTASDETRVPFDASSPFRNSADTARSHLRS
jgi:predicted PurR-regulated permease PerM